MPLPEDNALFFAPCGKRFPGPLYISLHRLAVQTNLDFGLGKHLQRPTVYSRGSSPVKGESKRQAA
jgi:hypothetical protein